MKFQFIRAHAGTWPVSVMCRMLGVSRSGYYDWRDRPPSMRTTANTVLLGDIRRIQARHSGRYGSPRMHAALRAEGRGCSRGRVERLMRRHGIRALAGRRFRPSTTDSRHYLPIAPNLLPLPTKWTLHVGQPLETGNLVRTGGGVGEAVKLARTQVRERLQGLVSEGLGRRKSVFLA